MRSQLVRIGTLAIAALALAACRDESKDLVAPNASSKLFVVEKPPGGILRPWVPNPEDFAEITAGDYHTCARKNNGNVYCWGKIGGPNITSAPKVIPPTLALQGATQISAGANHTCALLTTGAAYCWGSGDQGQLGLANGQFSTLNSGPVAGPGWNGAPLTYTSIGAGGYSTCGTTAGGVYCWGRIADAQNPYLGNQGPAVPTLVSTYNGFTSMTVGTLHACGYIGWASESYCWGADQFGQVGQDPASTYYYPNTRMVIFAMPNGMGATVNRVSAHGNFTCADITNGTVQCFGDDEFGSLGNFRSGWGIFTHVPQTVGGGTPLRGVSTGSKHACALDPSGYAFCWGAGLYGQLGNGGSFNLSSTPAAVTGGRTYRAIAAGTNHTCAIGTDNKLYCWGQVNYRQLGTRIVDAFGFEVTNGFSPNPVQTLDPQ